jgi:DNA modification methylase
MLPAIGAHAVAAYTRPGDLVFDPMCGIVTTGPSTRSLHHRAGGSAVDGVRT